MRVLLAACVLLCGCTYETNYYGAVDDGGVTDMGFHDQYGEWHEDADDQSIFKPDAKLFGSAELVLQAAPPAPPAAFQVWPATVFDTPARAGAAALIDVTTRDGSPQMMTVSLGNIVPPWQVAGMNGPEIVAVMEIGVGGINIMAEVDFVRGVQFSLAAAHLRLYAVYVLAANAGAMVGVQPTVTVGASLSTGVVAHGRQPQRTKLRFNIPAGPGGGSTDIWWIPAFAKSFRLVCEFTNAQFNVSVLGPALGTPLSLFPAVAFPTPELPIPSGGQFVAVYNTGAGMAMVPDYAVIFDLAL